jgi:hypothetical protein
MTLEHRPVDRAGSNRHRGTIGRLRSRSISIDRQRTLYPHGLTTRICEPQPQLPILPVREALVISSHPFERRTAYRRIINKALLQQLGNELITRQLRCGRPVPGTRWNLTETAGGIQDPGVGVGKVRTRILFQGPAHLR